MKVVSPCKISDGVLTFSQRSVFLNDIRNLKDGDYIITIERKKKKRSVQQNRYYWGVIIPIVKGGLNDAGYKMTTEGVHEYLKGQFAIVEIINERTGEVLKSIGSSSEMTTSQIMDYFAEITQWAAEYLNIQIPQPNEQLTIE